MRGMNSHVVMVLLMPAAAGLVLMAFLHMLFFRKFSMRVILTIVTGAAMLIPSLLSIR
jgi:hypothetical protein